MLKDDRNKINQVIQELKRMRIERLKTKLVTKCSPTM